MTARDWVHTVLEAVLAYPLLVLVLFLLRPLGSDIKPFEAALIGTGAAFGASIAERWRQNRATDRNARLAKGETATMRGSFKGEGESLPTRWRMCRFDLTENSLRVRPLYYPRGPSTFSLDTLEVLGVGKHQGWRRWIRRGSRWWSVRPG